jgi:hypothetical protein
MMTFLNICVAQEERFLFFGILYNTFINDDIVNVRNYPSLEGIISLQINRGTRISVIGVSEENQFIDNYYGNWLKIRISENQPNPGKEGWVFSKYVDTGAIRASELRIIEMPPKEERQAQTLIGVYQLNGVEQIVTFYPHKEEDQNFYTFAFNIEDKAFHYSNIPGSYAWYPETNELKHISYIGTSMESAWVIFTNDFKYILEDFGTNTGIRGLKIWRINDGEEIFWGNYYRNINLHEYTIEIVYLYDWYSIMHDLLEDEIKSYAENFKIANPEPADMVQNSRDWGYRLDLMIICEYNFDTGIRKILRGQYIYR